MWLYEQATGRLLRNAEFIASGYSGHGDGVNNPAMEAAPNVGPIPRGRWVIGEAFKHPIAGPVCMRLSPEAATNTFGRDGFMIHGGFGGDDRTASEGCVILSRTVREQIAASEDRGFLVV